MIFEQLKNLIIIFWSTMLIVLISPTASGSDQKEEEIGREIVALYLGAAPLIDNPETLQYVNTLGQYIVQFTSEVNRDRNWAFGVLETDSINAFAAPGGYILITQGLLDLIETEDQLAFILAHEVSHVVKQHHLKVIQRQAQMKQVIARMQGNMSVPNELFNELSDVYKDFAIKGLDKNAEHEADIDGTLLATRAGFSSYAGQEVLFILADFYKDGNETELFYKTHPHPLTRIDELTTQFSDGLDKFAANSTASSAFRRLKR